MIDTQISARSTRSLISLVFQSSTARGNSSIPSIPTSSWRQRVRSWRVSRPVAESVLLFWKGRLLVINWVRGSTCIQLYFPTVSTKLVSHLWGPRRDLGNTTIPGRSTQKVYFFPSSGFYWSTRVKDRYVLPCNYWCILAQWLKLSIWILWNIMCLERPSPAWKINPTKQSTWQPIRGSNKMTS